MQIQLKTTILEVGISKTIQGKTYNNVARSQVEVQYKVNNVFQTGFTFKFYVAKGIGMIAIYSTTPAGDLSISELTSYTIK
jgi:hypothetical protein